MTPDEVTDALMRDIDCGDVYGHEEEIRDSLRRLLARTDTDLYLEARDAIGFLRSCIRSGERLSAEDDRGLDGTLDRLRSALVP